MTARAVEGLVAKWIDELVRGATESFDAGYNFSRRQCADDLKEALTADRAESGELPDGDWSRESMQFLAYRLRNMSAIGFDADTLTDAASWLEKLAARAASCGGGEVVVAWMDPETLDAIHASRRESLIAHHVGAMRRVPADYTVPLYTTPPTPSAGVGVTEAMVERASLAYEIQLDGEVYGPEVPRIAMHAALTAALEGGKS